MRGEREPSWRSCAIGFGFRCRRCADGASHEVPRVRMIGTPLPPVARLIARLGESGGNATETTWVVGAEAHPDPEAIPRAAADAGVRFLILSWVGSHPDARSPLLRGLWDQEERARATGRPVLTLRLAPLLGPQSPLLGMLRSRPVVPREGRHVIQPVAEDDAIETLERALDGRAAWEGWYELVGPDALSLAELTEMAQAVHAAPTVAAWEPPLEVILEQSLAEPDAWLEHFALTAQPVLPATSRGAV